MSKSATAIEVKPEGLPAGVFSISDAPNKFKPDSDLDQASETAYRVTAGELRAFVERFERLEIEKKDISDHQKEVMAEAKSRGYDTKALRKLIALRKKDPQEIAEEQAVLDLYMDALGM